MRCVYVFIAMISVQSYLFATRSIKFAQSGGLSAPTIYSDLIIQNISNIDQPIRVTGGISAIQNGLPLDTYAFERCVPTNCVTAGGWTILPSDHSARFAIVALNRSTHSAVDGYDFFASGIIEVNSDRGALVSNAWFNMSDSSNRLTFVPININAGRPF